MAPISEGPFLQYLLDYWIGQGVSRFVISVGYMADVIVAYFGSRYKNSEIFYIYEYTPLGTGGAIKKAIDEFKWNEDCILIANGDTWFEVDLRNFYVDSTYNGKPVTVALKIVEHNDRYAGVLIDDGLIKNFGLSHNESGLINGGCYLIDIKYISKFMIDFRENFSFEEDVLKPLAKKNEIAGSVQKAIFLDIGVPSDYLKVKEVIDCYHFSEGKK